MKLLNSSKEVQAPKKEWLYSGGVTRRGKEKAIYESVEGVYCVTSSSPVPSLIPPVPLSPSQRRALGQGKARPGQRGAKSRSPMQQSLPAAHRPPKPLFSC